MLPSVWRRRRASKLLVILFFVGTLFVLFNGYFLSSSSTGIDLSFSGEETSVSLEKRIVDLSRRYVRTLAREQSLMRDGPYAGGPVSPSGGTFYELKKTLAVLLESMLVRLDVLEASLGARLGNLSRRQDFLQPPLYLRSQMQMSLNDSVHPFSAVDLWNGEQERCELMPEFRYRFPVCFSKIKWLETFWHSDPCYAQNGVDGTLCSFRIYLSEVEHHCPPLPWRAARLNSVSKQFILPSKNPPPIEELFRLMDDDQINYNWIKSRIQRLWPKWIEARRLYRLKGGSDSIRRIRRHVFLHIGCLTKESGFRFGDLATKGGPLGELVQWSDLITSLFVLGHNISISSQISTMRKLLKQDPGLKSSCPLKQNGGFDVIFTDIVGLRQIKKRISGFQHIRCKLRVLDSFGTQAEFNSAKYFDRHIRKGQKTQQNHWGGLELNLQQFYTLFPHKQDNSFLGFVVTSESVCTATEHCDPLKKENIGLVYGKEAYIWDESGRFLENVNDLIEIHGTVQKDKKFKIPDFVINHGLLNGSAYADLLRRSRILFGLGFPYEGPTPLEAIAHGVVFINPRFKVPKGRKTHRFFADKPTFRELSSQNPYAEEFIGEPYVLTVDISNVTEFRAAVITAISTKVTPMIPHEFTPEGMLERIGAYMEHQDFCTEDVHWPPFSSAQIIVADPNESCSDACWKKGFVCEYSYFSKINLPSVVQKYSMCTKFEEMEETYAPAVDDETCYLQKDILLFSCATTPEIDIRRICPCRDYIPAQVALCLACS